MRGIRIAWLVVVGVVLTVAVVPALRGQARVQWARMRLPDGIPDGDDALRFVEQHYPRDPEMLLAAATPAGSGVQAELALRAVQSGGGPAAWAVYCAALPAIPCPRIASGGVDPEDQEGVRDMERHLASESRARPTEKDARPVLDALRAWEAADPENGLPIALEAIVLYSLNRDDEAFIRWQTAARKPLVSSRAEEVRQAVARLYRRMGCSDVEAMIGREMAVYEMHYYAEMRNGARIGFYEGRLAQIEGRARDAVAWWNATADLGHHMEAEDAGTRFLVGAAVQTIGAQPVWQWEEDADTGLAAGPLYYTDPLTGERRTRRLWYGPQHGFYVKWAGEEASRKLRDRLIGDTTKLMQMQKRMGRVSEIDDLVARTLPLAWALPRLGISAAFLCTLLLLLLIATSLPRSDRAPGYGTISGRREIAAALPFVAGLFAVALLWRVRGPDAVTSSCLVWGGPVLVALATVGVGLLTARLDHSNNAVAGADWRQRLGHLLPFLVAASALVYLLLAAAAVPARTRAMDYWRQELKPAAQRFGSARQHPTIPRDAWRDAYPPKAARPGREG